MNHRKPKPIKPPAISVTILAGGLSSRMGRDKSRIRIGRRTMLGHVRAIASQLGLPIRVLRRDAVPRCGPIGGIYTALARTRSDAILFLACDMPFITPAFLNQMLNTFRRTSRTFDSQPASSSSPHSRGAHAPSRAVRRALASNTSLRQRMPATTLLIQAQTSSLPLLGERAGVRANNPTDISLLLPIAIFASHKNLFGLPCLIPRDSLPIISRQIAKSRFSLQSLARALKAQPLVPSRQPTFQLLNLNTPEEFQAAQRHLKNQHNHKP